MRRGGCVFMIPSGGRSRCIIMTTNPYLVCCGPLISDDRASSIASKVHLKLTVWVVGTFTQTLDVHDNACTIQRACDIGCMLVNMKVDYTLVVNVFVAALHVHVVVVVVGV